MGHEKRKETAISKLLGERRAVSFSLPLGPKMPKRRPEHTNGSNSEQGIRQ